MPIYEYTKLLQSDTANTTAAVATDCLDAQDTAPGYNKGGVPWGLHVVVTTTYGNLTEGVRLQILHSAADDITTSSEVHSEMFVPADEMVKGAHFFIPAGSRPLARYIGAAFTPVSTAANAGKSTMWLGPKSGGEV